MGGFLASAASEPSALLIEGEPGIGKTTLWLATQELAGTRGSGCCRRAERRPNPCWPTRPWPTCWTGCPQPRGRICPNLSEPRWTRCCCGLTRLGHRSTRCGRGFLSVVEYLAEDGPLLVAIDDLQWIDPSSTHVVAFAARRLSGPVGILGSVRTDAGSGAAGAWLQMPRPDAVNRLRLNPLGIHDLHAAVSARLRRPFSRPAMGAYMRCPAETPSTQSNWHGPSLNAPRA